MQREQSQAESRRDAEQADDHALRDETPTSPAGGSAHRFHQANLARLHHHKRDHRASDDERCDDDDENMM